MVMTGGKHGIVLTTLKQNRSHTVIMSSKRTIQSLAWFEWQVPKEILQDLHRLWNKGETREENKWLTNIDQYIYIYISYVYGEYMGI